MGEAQRRTIVSDVKATSKKCLTGKTPGVETNGPKPINGSLKCISGFFENGFNVANEAYLVYFNGLKNEPMFEQTLKFELHLVKLECDDSWVEESVVAAANLLKSDEYPEASSQCENCNYLRARWKVSPKTS